MKQIRMALFASLMVLFSTNAFSMLRRTVPQSVKSLPKIEEQVDLAVAFIAHIIAVPALAFLVYEHQWNPSPAKADRSR